MSDPTPLPELDASGFLKDGKTWRPDHAQALVNHLGLLLDERHFEIIYFLRNYYETYHHLPNNRMFIRAVALALGAEKGNSVHLNLLFKGHPVKHASLAAGLPKPPGCL